MRKKMNKLLSVCVAAGLLSSSWLLPSVKATDTPVLSDPSLNQQVVLENMYLRKIFSLENNHFKTLSVENLLTQENERLLRPSEDSEEFSIHFIAPRTVAQAKNWTATVSSESHTEGDANRKNAIFDGDPATWWHTNYGTGAGPVNQAPHWAEIRFDAPKNIRSFGYTPRSVANANGNAKGYKFYIKTAQDSEFQLVKTGTFSYTDSQTQWVELDERKEAVSEIKFEITSTVNNRNLFGAIAEFDVSDKTLAELQGGAGTNTLVGSELTVKNHAVSAMEGGKRLTVEFNPIVKMGEPITVKYVAELKDTEKFIRTYLELDTTGDKSRVTIDTIDLQSLNITDEKVVWKLPPQENIAEMGGFHGFYAGLGQPVYLKGAFYTGSEFPLAHNTVESGKLFSRYYSGKSLQQLNPNGAYKTWPVILGAGRNNSTPVLQQDFYDYLRVVGTETTFRKQYNSWFDHMKDINANNIQVSFKEIDDGFASYGIAPLDSYVVDDGWQDSNTLWGFNSKFPNQLYTSSKDVKRIGSNFGLWLGPQGGYGGGATQMANALTRLGLGSSNGGVIHVGDKRYVDNLTARLLDYQNKFDINYWKLDGMLLRPVGNTTPHFIGGGYHNMYSMTETHERWIELYKALRENREAHGAKLWINLTSYINPSPWFLQWVNSIWMQNAGDVDYQDHVKYNSIDFGDDAAEAITYRDDRYQQLVTTRQWQLPFSNIYNHDPVYGNRAHEGKGRNQVRFTDDGFRDYLYTLGTRGTGFWEFYYSYALMNPEKWQINAEAVNWIEDNFEILRNAKMHGGRPGDGDVYGYSAWTEQEGIVSIRNPKNERQSYRLVLNNTVGMREGTNGLYRKVVHGKAIHAFSGITNYGDAVEVTLEPYETLILQYSKQQDVTAPRVKGSRFLDNTTLEIEFDEKVNLENAHFEFNGLAVEQAQLEADYRTVKLTVPAGTKHKQSARVTFDQVKDVAGTPNVASGSENVVYYKDGNILNLPMVQNGSSFNDAGVERHEEFTVSVTANLSRYNQILAQQGDEWQLLVDEDGRVNFTVKGTTVKSAPFMQKQAEDKDEADAVTPLNTDVNLTAIRYENGSIRIYVNGLASNSAYNKETAKLPLTKAVVKVGTEDFGGTLTNFKLKVGASKYDEVAEEAELDNNGIRLVELPIANSEASSIDEIDNGVPHPPESATDGNLSTYWASSPNVDNRTTPQHLTIELEEVKDIKVVTYIPRQIRNAVGNITVGKVEVSEDKITWKTFPTEGHVLRWSAEDISSKQIVADTPVRGKYVRLSATDAYHWNTAANKGGSVIAAAEFSAWGEKAPELTFDYLRAAVQELKAVDLEAYLNTENIPALLEEAEALLDESETYTGTQDDINLLTEKLKTAFRSLERKPEVPEVPEVLAVHLKDASSHVAVTLTPNAKIDRVLNLRVQPRLSTEENSEFDIDLMDEKTNEVYTLQGTAKVYLPVLPGRKISKVYYLNSATKEKEDLPYKVVQKDGKDFVEFETNHFSIYGIEYAVSGGRATLDLSWLFTVNEAEKTEKTEKDRVPNTGVR